MRAAAEHLEFELSHRAPSAIEHTGKSGSKTSQPSSFSKSQTLRQHSYFHLKGFLQTCSQASPNQLQHPLLKKLSLPLYLFACIEQPNIALHTLYILVDSKPQVRTPHVLWVLSTCGLQVGSCCQRSAFGAALLPSCWRCAFLERRRVGDKDTC